MFCHPALVIALAFSVASSKTNAQPVVQADGRDLRIEAPGDLLLSTGTSACSADQLCGLIDEVSRMRSTIESLSAELSSARQESSTAVAGLSSAVAALPTNDDVVDLISNALGVVELGGALIGQSTTVSLGAMNQSDLLTIEISVTGCNAGTTSRITVVHHFSPQSNNPDVVSVSTEAILYSPTVANATFRPKVYALPVNGGRVQLQLELFKPEACQTSDGAAQYRIVIWSDTGDFDANARSSGDFTLAMSRVLGESAALNREVLNGILQCQEEGLAYDAASSECFEVEQTSVGGATTEVQTVAGGADGRQMLIFSVARGVTAAGQGVFGSAQYTCEYGAGSLTAPVFGTAIFGVRPNEASPSLTGAAGDEIIDAATPHLNRQRLSWVDSGVTLAGNNGVPTDSRLALNVPASMDCVVSVMYWNASGSRSRSIPITNPSFEYPQVRVNDWRDSVQRYAEIPGWEYALPQQGQDLQNRGGFVNMGVFRPTASVQFTIHSGQQVGFINSFGGFQQDTGVSITPNTHYRLGNWLYYRQRWPGCKIYLCAGRCIEDDQQTHLAVDTLTDFVPTPPYSELRRNTLDYRSGGTIPAGTLHIWIHGLAQGGQLNFDHFTLVATPL